MSMTQMAQRLEARRIRLSAPRGLVPFLSVGVLGLTTDLVILAFAERMGYPLWASRAVSLPLATLVTWSLNRRHTFGASGLKAHHEALRYFGVAVVAQTVSSITTVECAQRTQVGSGSCGQNLRCRDPNTGVLLQDKCQQVPGSQLACECR